ncbi:MAG: WlaTC/HtrL family glycosyltransferase [Sulfobacillus sp.]
MCFVCEAMQMDPFETEHFVWADIGYFRDPQIVMRYADTFPSASKIPPGRITYLQMRDFALEDSIRQADGICGQFKGMVRIGGGMFAGHRKTIVKYGRKYLDMFARYQSAGRFAGKDQDLIASIVCEEPDLFNLVRPDLVPGHPDFDHWFYLAEHLSPHP